MKTGPSMNKKAFEGLTLPGLAAHIASSILLRNQGVGTLNDCKHAIAHNVRAFQKRLIVQQEIENENVLITDNAAAATREQIELEHAIPVGCLMNVLFHTVETSDLAVATAQVANTIKENTVLVWVTKDEHRKLNAHYQCTMPNEFDTYPWREKLARYKHTPGVSALSPFASFDNKALPAEDDLDAETKGDFSPIG